MRFLLYASLLLSFACSKPEHNSASQLLQEHRIQKDAEFRDPLRSPLGPEKISSFKGLQYFPFTSGYAVKAVFTRLESEQPFALPHSHNTSKPYIKYGMLNFEIKGKAYTLAVYQSETLKLKAGLENYLFVPFTDETSGHETYGGGRYLDFSIPSGKDTLIDFNYAYNPYCAFSASYTCPIPPAENHLPIKVEAGEKAPR